MKTTCTSVFIQSQAAGSCKSEQASAKESEISPGNSPEISIDAIAQYYQPATENVSKCVNMAS